jgi:hypothetical protein
MNNYAEIRNSWRGYEMEIYPHLWKFIEGMMHG